MKNIFVIQYRKYELRYSNPPLRPSVPSTQVESADLYDQEHVDVQVEELTNSIAELRAEIARLQSKL